MTEIFLIRHTQAEGNLYRMMQGHWDGDVTAMGWKQIEALAERFRDVHPDAVYSSDLYRTRMTATAAARHDGLEVRCDRRLREIDLGPWETGFFGNLLHQQPEKMADFLMHPGDWQLEGAETCAQVRERAFEAFMELVCRHDGEKVVIVSHGVTIRCLFSRILNVDLNDAEKLPIQGNTAVSHLWYDKGEFRVDYTNDQSHLEAMGLPQWHKTASLRHEAIDPIIEKEFYTAAYEQTWTVAHGSSVGFNPQSYLAGAAIHSHFDAEAVLRLFDGDEPVGLVDMDTKRGESEGIGWISLLWLREDYRNRGYGVQLLARALKKYSSLGRTRLQLNVAEGNGQARAFYKKHGFEEIGSSTNSLGRLLLLEKKLEGKKYV